MAVFNVLVPKRKNSASLRVWYFPIGFHITMQQFVLSKKQSIFITLSPPLLKSSANQYFSNNSNIRHARFFLETAVVNVPGSIQKPRLFLGNWELVTESMKCVTRINKTYGETRKLQSSHLFRYFAI